MGKYYDAGLNKSILTISFGEGLVPFPIVAFSLDKDIFSEKTVELNEFKVGVNGNVIGFQKQNNMSDFSINILKYAPENIVVLNTLEARQKGGEIPVVALTFTPNPSAGVVSQAASCKVLPNCGFIGFGESAVTSDGENGSSVTLNFTDFDNTLSALHSLAVG